MNKIKSTKGITLISLVVTIIILLILAGVTIATLMGENGIIKRAGQAKEEYEKAQIAEQESLNELEKQLEDYNKGLPDNTKDTEAGTEVKIPSEWYSTTSAYVSTEDGSVVKKAVKVASVTAIATGNGETVPVPNGFYYVGGTINTGVVISDNLADKNKYVNYAPTGEIKEGIPSGVAYNEDGTINTENSELKGNQFVWIPVSAGRYVKKDWGKANATWERQTNTAELPQIQKYGGFYIGRYEAGTSNISLSTDINFASQNTASNWVNDNFSIRDGLNHTATGKITLKAGEIPYYHVDYETALKLSNSMYNTDYVQSGLVTGTMWDAMMKFIADNDDTVVTSSDWGNYTNGNVTYTEGKGRYATVNSGNGAMTSAFTKSNGAYNYGIKTTAISEDVKKKNLYDVAGNLWEWTQEAAYPNNTVESYMLRGGSFYNSSSDFPACYRANNTATLTYTYHGFRPALYIK